MTTETAPSRPQPGQAQAALYALGLANRCSCAVVELVVGGARWFTVFTPSAEEHRRRQLNGLGAVTDTGLLHALWALPEDIPVPLGALRPDDANTLKQAGGGHALDHRGAVTRSFRAAGTVTAVAVVATLLNDAVRRVMQLPPIYRRVAIPTASRGVRTEALDRARTTGVGVVEVDAGVPAVRLAPAAAVLGVPAVYRWWVSELAYRNWRHANCAHCTS